MQNKPLCFVDVETTGINAVSGRIIEVGLLRVENDEIVKTYQSLVNPDMRVDPYIEVMTGIKGADLDNAPSFYDIKDELFELLEGSVFIAHNVRFDYGFIRQEFKRFGINYISKHFCTVKLARNLYPNLGRYNLDSIITNFNIENLNRHRAFDDAKVLWDFYKLSKERIEKEVFEATIAKLLKKPSLPPGISQSDVDALPESPGVYIMYGENEMPIYIGKSINIKERVMSHFINDYNSGTDMKIIHQIKRIETVKTAGALSALLLESKLIKDLQPVLNRMLRNSRAMSVLLKKINPAGFNSVELVELNNIKVNEIPNILGVFKNLKQAKDYLYEIAKEFQLCPKILGLEKGNGACFYHQLEQCKGACINKENYLKYNLRFDEGFYIKKIKPWNFKGPIIIKEEGELNEAHLIDKWCYLGSIKDGTENFTEIKKEYKFDYDAYKILRRFILDPKNNRYISTEFV